MDSMREKIKQGLSEQLDKLQLPLAVLGGSNEMNHHDATEQGDAA
jgi:hypothetical protein